MLKRPVRKVTMGKERQIAKLEHAQVQEAMVEQTNAMQAEVKEMEWRAAAWSGSNGRRRETAK